jgi:ATP-dependent Clp protease adaptor protein ClpS
MNVAFDLIMGNSNNDQNEPGSGTAVITERKVEARPPSLYKVLLHNDDFTPMDFVVMVLETYFSKDRNAATEVMLAVHHKGVGVCGTYPFEIAETKVSLVMECARENEHPLQCTMEKI